MIESDCIEILDTWIIENRNTIYNTTIKSPDNSQDVLEEYSCSLKDFGSSLINAVKKEDIATLHEMEWPDELMECIKDVNTKTDILDRIEHWCITYPFVKSVLHINELSAENAGVN